MCCQTASLLLNSFHFLLLHIPVSNFRFDPPMKLTLVCEVTERRIESSEKWRDQQAECFLQLSNTRHFLLTLNQLIFLTLESFTRSWTSLIPQPSSGSSSWSILCIDTDLNQSQSLLSSEQRLLISKVLGEYELICGSIELLYAIVYYLR